jgi:hypothetical protein
VGAGVVASVAFGMYQVTVLFPWRIVPHCELLFQCLAAASVLSLVVEGSQARRPSIAALPLLIAGLLLLFYRDDRRLANLTLTIAVVAALIMAIRAGAHRWAEIARRHGTWLVTALAALALYDAARSSLKSIRQRSNVFDGLPRPEAELYAWMQTTPKGAVFLTLPTIETMRLHGKRAIVVDWKSSPASPAEIFEWYRRLEDVSGHSNWQSDRDLRNYDAMDAARLGMLRDRYGIDYAVLRRGSERALSAYKKCFENQAFIVIEVVNRS